MYAAVARTADAAVPKDRYVDQVAPVETRLMRSTRWFRELNPWAIDAVLGTVITIVGIIGLFADYDASKGYRHSDGWAVLLSLACTLPFFVRRRFPLTTHLTIVTALVVLSTIGNPANVQSQVILITAFTVGSHCDGVKRLIGLAGLIVGVAVVALVGIPDATTANVLLSGAFYVTAYFFGSTVRNRRLYLDQLEERAVLLERERDEEAQRAVGEERLRIAQELHDVVAHSMGVIAVQAGVGAHVIETDPVEAKKSLEAIARTSRSTLTEIRRMLGVLREGEGADYAPAPGLGDLDRLVRDVGAAGLPVAVDFDGTQTDIPPGVDFTAYRIVQEALTNALKHAGPAHARVHVGYQPAALCIEIVDDGRGINGKPHPGGHGLMGMRERVGVYGGSFEAGPVTGGGFRVAVRLPYGEPE